MDADSLAERIIKDLDAVFAKDPAIVEFAILPVEVCVTNKCPVICISHHVGLESWSLKHVFQYAYKNIIEFKKSRKQTDSEVLLSWTRAVLLINPDIQFAWNIRKELLDLDKVDVQNEINFSSVVLSGKHKCSEAFIHRRWLLEKLISLNDLKRISCDQSLIEFNLCAKAAERYPQNYYAWSHRIWVAQRSQIELLQLIFLELESTESWCSKHISDHSGLHYRQFLLKLWLNNAGSAPPSSHHHYHHQGRHHDGGFEKLWSKLLDELFSNGETIKFYQGRESLWYHRRFILESLTRRQLEDIGPPIPSPTPSPKNSTPNQSIKRQKKSNIAPFLEDFPREEEQVQKQILENETKFLDLIKENSSKGDKQSILLERHRLWFHKFILTPSSSCPLV